VWATENTREAIFDAMKRRETYSTTGPRMIVASSRLDFAPATPTIVCPRCRYAKGVPMGGDLGKAPNGKSPTFLVAALKDPIGANLDRIQIVKAGSMARAKFTNRSTTSSGGPDKRKPGANGKLPRSATPSTLKTPRVQQHRDPE